jgi:hypothetical protein
MLYTNLTKLLAQRFRAAGRSLYSVTEVTPEVGEVVASVVPEGTLADVFKHLEEETAKIRESMADSSRSKPRRQRELKRAEARDRCGSQDYSKSQWRRDAGCAGSSEILERTPAPTLS